MNCQNFQIIVHDLASGRAMEESAKAQAVMHSAACEPCSTSLRNEQDLTNALRELSARMDGEAPDRVKQTVMAEFRSLQAQKVGLSDVNEGHPGISTRRPAFPVVPAGYSPRYRIYAAAAAVVLTVAAGAAVIRFRQSRLWPSTGVTSHVAKQDAVAPQINPVGETVTQVEEPSDDTPARPAPKRFRHSVAAKPRAVRYSVSVRSLGFQPAMVDEVTTDFIPLAYAAGTTVQEGGQVMRVEMPRYAMARFGVPVNVERYDERVKADLWVGPDGLAQAIRFVQ